MNVSRGGSARSLFAAVVLGLSAFLVLVQYAPDSVAFSPNNYGWDGMQGVASAYSVNFTTSLSSLPAKSMLVVSQPSINFTESEASVVRSFLDGGGTLLVADKSGVANSLLSKLGSVISVDSRYSISDHTYNWKSSSVPTALVLPAAKLQFRFLSNVTGIALNQPSPLRISSAKATDLAITSQFSTTSSSFPGLNGGRGPFIVMAAEKVGEGTLIVVGDSQFLLNSEWTIANNEALIGNLFARANVFIDASHWGVSSIAQLKSQLGEFYGFISSSPTRYLATLFIVGIALAFVPSRPSKKRPTPFNAAGKGLDE